MITLDNVTLTFPDGGGIITAVDSVSLVVPSGAITGITGPSGSGKSSLLAIASTLIRPQSGRVMIDNVDAAGLNQRDATTLRREKIGIVFQQPNLLPSLTALDQLVVMNELGGRSSRVNRSRVTRHAEELLDAVGLQDHRGKRPHQLSGGQRQRVNIARALMNEPSVLVVDEPTSALDQERGIQIMELLVELTSSRSTATLLVTHDLSLATRTKEFRHMVDGALVA